MTTEEKFNAAVNVIRNLPKNGAYQPSNDLMLRFYGYYKQATEGPCHLPKPGFWDVVKKAKWDAWNRLGNMSRTEAMNNYVDELKKIVETMSYTENVANFLGSLDSFYESVPAGDLEMLVGPVLERIRSQPGSPLSGSPIASRETSPNRIRNASRHITSSLETSPASSHSASPLPPETDGEEEFIDTVESVPDRSQKESTKILVSSHPPSTALHNNVEKVPKITKNTPAEQTNDSVSSNGLCESSSEDGFKQDRGRIRGKKDEIATANAEFFNQISITIQNLQKNLDRVTEHVKCVESKLKQTQKEQGVRRYPRWWPIRECSPRMFALIMLWPFVVQFLISFSNRYRRQKRLL